jgi:hypothetical protein
MDTYAQENDRVLIAPIKETKIYKFRTEIFVYGMQYGQKLGRINTATNMLMKKTIYNTLMDVGITACMYNNDKYRCNLSTGYMHSRYAYNIGFTNTGITSNWFSFDVNTGVYLFGFMGCVGVKNNIYISDNKEKGDSYFTGIYSDCLNHNTTAWYVSLGHTSGIINGELRMGSYIKLDRSSCDRRAYEDQVVRTNYGD